MLGALGLTSVDQLFDDIPEAMRASPLTGANRSLTALTDSTTPNAAVCSSDRPASGSSTKTMSPSWSAA